MEIYRFKCKCCGATRYKKPTKNIYRCLYCGEEVEVYRKSETEQQPVQPAVQPAVQPEQTVSVAQTQPEKKTSRPAPRLNTHNLLLLILCVAGGWLGIHKFMQGKIFWGLVYLFTGGVMGIGVFIDTMIHLIDFAKDYKKYRRELEYFEK